MNKKYPVFILFLILLSGFSWNCQKTFSLGPSSAPAFTSTFTSTATFTSTSTPCGYPGNTCTLTYTPTATNTPTNTPTFTPTNSPTITDTFTVTSTPTPTATFTVTNTPSPLPTPLGLFGLQDSANYPTILWAKDSNPSITSYKIYVSTDDATWTLLGNPAKTAFPTPYCQVNDTTQAAPFTRYYYVVSSNGGIAPDSPPSPQVWAQSGTTTNNTLTFNVTGPSPLKCTLLSGSVPGGVSRIWLVEDTSLNPFWTWGEGAVLLTSVNFGYNATGLTYLPSQTLTTGTTYGFGTFTLNNHNWVIDTSAQGFIAP